MKYCGFALLSCSMAALQSPGGQDPALAKIWIRYEDVLKGRRMLEKTASLVFDNSTSTLAVESSGRPLHVHYSDIERVVFEETSHMRGGKLGYAIGGSIGDTIREGIVRDYWCYLEYRAPSGTTRSCLIEVPKSMSAAVTERMKGLFGDRVTVSSFPAGHEVESKSLKARDSSQAHKANLRRHPVPEIQMGKSLVVVVCPALGDTLRYGTYQVKLHANDRVVAVNKMGTYSFCHLDPGEYLLVSQAANAHGIRLRLEAGKAYYFLQNVFAGYMFKPVTTLSMHSKELVMYELRGANLSEWREK